MPGEARQDWELIVELAQRIGLPWKYDQVSDVYAEMATAMPSLKNISWERIDREDSVIYPSKAPDVPGDEIVFTNGFPTADGRGRIVPADLLPPDEVPDVEYPLVLTTGRLLEHWHTGAMTRRAGVLDAIEPQGIAAMNPREIAKQGLHLGDTHHRGNSTRRASRPFCAQTGEVADGMIFIPFCFAESPANMLTNPKLDPVGKIPEFKYCAARVEVVRAKTASGGRGRGVAVRLIGLAGWSGSGKTTLLAKLIPALVARGRSVSTVKHAHHEFDIDKPGKDSHTHRLAGAREVLVSGARRWALMHELRDEREPTLTELVTHIVARRSRHRRRVQNGRASEDRGAPQRRRPTAALSRRSEHLGDRERHAAGKRDRADGQSRRHRSDRQSRRPARAAVRLMTAAAGNDTAGVAGLVLAGGRSVRFGGEKAAAPLDGRPLLLWAVERLGPHCVSVAVSVRPGTETEALTEAHGLTALYDAAGDAGGPLAGVKSGLIWAESIGARSLAVSPCDAPLLPDDLFARLIEGAAGGAAMAETSDGRQPLCAVWPVAALPMVEAALEGGAHPPTWQVLERVGARKIRFDSPAAFANLNTREDLAAVEAQRSRSRHHVRA